MKTGKLWAAALAATLTVMLPSAEAKDWTHVKVGIEGAFPHGTRWIPRGT